MYKLYMYIILEGYLSEVAYCLSWGKHWECGRNRK